MALSLYIPFKEQVIFFDKFMVDFLLHETNVIVQCDGRYWHDRPKVRRKDKGQDAYFAKAGYVVLRFDDDQINNQIKWCIKRIRKAVKSNQIPLINY